MKTTKKAYQAPRLTVHGDASQLTQATKTGARFDRSFNDPITVGDPILKS